MAEFDPDQLPAQVKCKKCRQWKEIPASWQELYDENGEKKPGSLGTKLPTSSRIQRIYYCTCGRRLASIRDPHW